jgi:hypothetical protein
LAKFEGHRQRKKGPALGLWGMTFAIRRRREPLPFNERAIAKPYMATPGVSPALLEGAAEDG